MGTSATRAEAASLRDLLLLGEQSARRAAYGRHAALIEDMMAAGRAAAWQASLTWDPAQGSVESWVELKAYRAAQDELRRWTGRQGKPRLEMGAAPLDPTVIQNDPALVDFDADPSTGRDAASLLVDLRDRLAREDAEVKQRRRSATFERDLAIALRHAMGTPLRCIADEEGVTVSRISQRLGVVREILLAELDDSAF